jgi:trehalose-6-phosphate synthase
MEKRYALWSNTDILLCSSLRDGLNIPIMEYVKSRLIVGKASSSAMICSEFSGCHEALRGVLIYNPFSQTEFCQTLDICLSMNSDTKEENIKLAQKYLESKSVSEWT